MLLRTGIVTAALMLGVAPSGASAAPQRGASSYVEKLVDRAIPTENSQLHHRLDHQEDYRVDISQYSVKFQECTFTKAYDPALAETKGSPTVLKTAQFVIFRLCPTADGDCSSCNYNYGEYMIDLESYLQATVDFFSESQYHYCRDCRDICTNKNERENDNTIDCNFCVDECAKIENMEENGYIDATEFLECQMIYDPEDDDIEAEPLYAGPFCSGSKIKIGVFKDEDCNEVDSSKDVDDYLNLCDGTQMKLSYALLKRTYTDTCISCLEPEDEKKNYQGNDAEDDDKVMDMCEALYDGAGKCEQTHGFDNGLANYYGYKNQLAQEDVVCDFIGSLKSRTYDDEEEIILVETTIYDIYQETVTRGQRFALAFSILATLMVAMYAAVLRRKLARLISYGAVNTLEMKDVSSSNKYMTLEDKLPPGPDDD